MLALGWILGLCPERPPRLEERPHVARERRVVVLVGRIRRVGQGESALTARPVHPSQHEEHRGPRDGGEGGQTSEVIDARAQTRLDRAVVRGAVEQLLRLLVALRRRAVQSQEWCAEIARSMVEWSPAVRAAKPFAKAIRNATTSGIPDRARRTLRAA